MSDDAPSSDPALTVLTDRIHRAAASEAATASNEPDKQTDAALKRARRNNGLSAGERADQFHRALMDSHQCRVADLCNERERLATDNSALAKECASLRQRDREFAALATAHVRDRWDTVVTVIGMGLGSLMIGAYKADSADIVAMSFSGGTLHGAGWGIVVLVALWMCLKSAFLTFLEWQGWFKTK